MKTILSGIRATGRLHFGSYLGAVKHFVDFQNQQENQCLYFIADFHTLTTLNNPAELRGNLIEIVKDYLAAGLDPEKSIIYAQSSIPEIATLAMYLGMLQSFGELARIPTYKDLVRKNPDKVTHGLFSYPVLMAADILGPQADIVPVGSDQIPNVELARNLAVSFNDRYGDDLFKIPEMIEEMIKVPGLDGGKMGKSEAQNAIGITMSKEEILSRYLKHGVTDESRVKRDMPGDPLNACRSVYPLHLLVTENEDTGRLIAKDCQSAKIGCADCKRLLVDNIWKVLEPFQERREYFSDKDDLVKEILHEGGKKAREIILPTIAKVADRMGIVTY
jgi:tryptophanyl-tRNA synthetase